MKRKQYGEIQRLSNYVASLKCSDQTLDILAFKNIACLSYEVCFTIKVNDLLGYNIFNQS